jgi:tetratricopeptide (TPR) repeat protein
MDKIPAAQAKLAAALRRNPKDTDALLQRGEIYWKAGKFAEAEADLLAVLRYQPDLAGAHYVLAKIQQGQGRVYNQRQELAEALRLRPDMLQVRIELAQVLLNQKDPEAALRLLDGASEEQKKLLPTVIERNWALLAKGEKGEARKNLEAGLAGTKTPEMLLQKAVLDLEESRYSDARAALNEILKQNPDDLRAMDLMVRSYTMENQTATGLDKLREYAAARPKSPEVQAMLGNWLLMAGNTKAARAAYAAAKAANPNYAPADLAMAQVDIETGRYDSARQILSALLSRDSKNVEAMLNLGTAQQLAGDRGAAVENYRKVLLAEPGNVAALNNLAFLMTGTTDQMDEGLKYAQQALQLAPESASVLDTTGWAYCQKGIYRTGIKYLETAVSKDGTALRRYHLAMAYIKAGEPVRGREALQIALKMNPNLPEAKAAQDMLQKISR